MRLWGWDDVPLWMAERYMDGWWCNITLGWISVGVDVER